VNDEQNTNTEKPIDQQSMLDALVMRLRDHAEIHASDNRRHQDVEQLQWAGDLRAAAILIERMMAWHGEVARIIRMNNALTASLQIEEEKLDAFSDPKI